MVNPCMVKPWMRILTVAALAVLYAASAPAADDPALARAKEMLRRTQEALRQAQSDNAVLQRAKTEAEQKLQVANQQVEAANKGGGKVAAALQAKLSQAAGAQTDLSQKLGDATAQITAVNLELVATNKQLAARDAELAQARQALEQSKIANASCEMKNVTLYGYARDVLDRYQKKGVWASLSQKDPVFGLKNVDVENVVQEYQLKFDSQKIRQ
jgi:chromosome segregation ATPase